MPTLVSVRSTKEKTTKDDIVVEMKSNTKNEEAVLLKAVNGDKKGPNEQVPIVVAEYGIIISQYIYKKGFKAWRPAVFTPPTINNLHEFVLL